MDKQEQYQHVFQNLDALCEGEPDDIALMATMACELYHGLDHFHWVGFYRVIDESTLKIGPYQGTHGCLTINFSRGVCGQCAREKRLINIPDVTQIPHHIACSSSTRSELVLPILKKDGSLLAVLDIDSNDVQAFDCIDEQHLEQVQRFFRS